ncbi:hypothetical protein O8E88_002376 [Flavobacterium psychrophilum]|uniref:hypothetical protein n=1 Tax=Flavobacterium psychrophilum TaxID=96345 RepID=UPI0004F883B8|nr:hypothetical protein [Flavobacterium psychrophilum]AIN75138.1 hypothetical protein FPG3_06675 [Flavobacterium psychrophilum FPG3]EKT2070542.1 hypothetical protein [Flavobacterium psychrophilum]EKT2072918.1 hypothetical protein [Flavobacterium psychrophilum]EKT4492332.1 hypothetical protein [Flavobacterium psychrophilum]MBF2044121.1 hypothetical protein [Flavobacterium psychrophilum]
MKKTLKYIFVIILFIYFIVNNTEFWDIDVWLRNKLYFKKIPAEFTTYKNINQNKITFGDKEMTLMFDSESFIYEYLLPNNNLIVKTINQGVFTFYKININGEIIDKTIFKATDDLGEETIIRGFIINTKEKYYTTWIFDGNKSHKNFVLQNENLIDSNEKNTIDEIKKNAKYINVDYDYNYPINKGRRTVNIITYLMNKSWYQYYCTEDFEIDLDYMFENSEYSGSLFQQYNYGSHEWEAIPNDKITYKHFHKFYEERITSSSGGNSSSTTTFEKGRLYTNVLSNKDTLKLFEDMYLDRSCFLTRIEINGKEIGTFSKPNNSTTSTYMFYENPKLNYSLFTNSMDKMYIIKRKK